MIYLDASALVSLFLPDAHSSAARRLIETTASPLALSTFGIAELASAASIKIRTGSVTAADAKAVLDLADAWVEATVMLADTEPADYRVAVQIVRRFEFGLRAPDALHLAICLRVDAALLTFDKRQESAARSFGIAIADA